MFLRGVETVKFGMDEYPYQILYRADTGLILRYQALMDAVDT